MKITLTKIKAANLVANNWRIQQRLPRITKLAEVLDLPRYEIYYAWLVYYSESDLYPICMFHEPKSPEDYYLINKIKIVKNYTKENK